MDQKKLREDYLDFKVHELKNCLTSLQGLLKILDEEMGGRLSPNEKNDLTAVIADADRIQNIIEEVCPLSRGKKTGEKDDKTPDPRMAGRRVIIIDTLLLTWVRGMNQRWSLGLQENYSSPTGADKY